MDATAMEGGAVQQKALPVRTAAPVRHSGRIEFASKEWLDGARAYLAPRVAERRDALRGGRMAVQEIFTDAPPHLGYANDVAAIHIVIDDGELTVGAGEIDNPDCSATIKMRTRVASSKNVPQCG